MFRFMVAASLVVVACGSPRRVEPKDAGVDALAEEVDGPPPPRPSVDAGPPPMVVCSRAAPVCELPPSTCLDGSYLVYYEGGECVGDECQYTTKLLYCASGCLNGGCEGGFT
ncbi:MAG: hypothetical protein KIT31_32945 [Deltaproteobacteria bacterium]|nr:hypothetical protein [Deltaproteobacteria bacterium]